MHISFKINNVDTEMNEINPRNMNDVIHFVLSFAMFIFFLTILDISIEMKNHGTVFNFRSQIFVCQQGTCSCNGGY